MTILDCVKLFDAVPKEKWDKLEVFFSNDGDFYYSPCTCASGIDVFEGVEVFAINPCNLDNMKQAKLN